MKTSPTINSLASERIYQFFSSHDLYRARKELLHQELTRKGVQKLKVTYHGHSDSGEIRDVTVKPKHIPIEAGLQEEIDILAWNLAYELFPGFENNEGGEGVIRWDIPQDQMTINHTHYYEEPIEDPAPAPLLEEQDPDHEPEYIRKSTKTGPILIDEEKIQTIQKRRTSHYD